MLNAYLLGEKGYLAIAEDEAKPEHSFLHVLLDSKEGDCASLSSLYLALAERLDIPLFGVCAPGHAFVRYESSKTTFNVEPTEEGARHWNITYAIGLDIPGTNAARSFYMRSLTKRQFLGLLLSNLGVAYGSQGKFEEEVEALTKALSVNPSDAGAWTSLGAAYGSQGKLDEAVEACRKALSINPNDAVAWFGLAVAYYAKREYPSAWECVRKCREAGGEVHPDFLRSLRRRMREPGT